MPSLSNEDFDLQQIGGSEEVGGSYRTPATTGQSQIPLPLCPYHTVKLDVLERWPFLLTLSQDTRAVSSPSLPPTNDDIAGVFLHSNPYSDG